MLTAFLFPSSFPLLTLSSSTDPDGDGSRDSQQLQQRRGHPGVVRAERHLSPRYLSFSSLASVLPSSRAFTPDSVPFVYVCVRVSVPSRHQMLVPSLPGESVVLVGSAVEETCSLYVHSFSPW